MKEKLKEAIVRTISYGDIFDYPLTEDELWFWLIGYKISKTDFQKEIERKNALPEIVQKQKGMIFLKGRKELIEKRLKKEKISLKKWRKAEKAAQMLKRIPSIKLIGITGAISMKNGGRDDDIDLFIVTKKNKTWTTRMLSVMALDIVGIRRKPKDITVKDRICLNMFVDENHLKTPKREQDLYVAHEILQMKPIYQKDEIYEKFLQENNWVKKILPNAYPKQIKKYIKNKKGNTGYYEKVLKKIQLSYMEDKKTKEVIRDGMLRFHPDDKRGYILQEWKKRLQHTS